MGSRMLWLVFLVLLPANAQNLIVLSAATMREGPLAPLLIAIASSASIRSGDDLVVNTPAGPATIQWVSDGQVSFVLPPNLDTGEARITIERGGEAIGVTVSRIENVAPGLFSASGTGSGAAIGLAIQDTLNRPLPRPFDPASQEEITLLGTGIRRAATVSVTVAGETASLIGVEPDPDHPGLDRIRIGPLPRGLSTRLGEQEVRLTADGVESNAVLLAPSMPAEASWGRRASLLLANSEMSVAELNGKIYVLGGYPASRITSRAVQVYDAAADTWSIAAPLPSPVNHSMPATTGGKLYLIGGQSDAGNTSFVNTVYEYDPANDTWRTRAPMPLARGGGAAAVVDGKIYVAGGRPPRGADFAVYDPQLDQWTTLPRIPTQRNHLTAVGFEGKVYVIGGRFEAGFQSPTTDAVEIFDTATGTWTRGASMPRPRGGLNAVEARGCIHVFGGEGNPGGPNGLFPDHDMYNPVTDTWSSFEPLPIAVHGVTGLAFLHGLIYLPGGGTAEGGSSGGTQHQVYRPLATCR
jgi:uncharacterized protein (TIGR03437 family)